MKHSMAFWFLMLVTSAWAGNAHAQCFVLGVLFGYTGCTTEKQRDYADCDSRAYAALAANHTFALRDCMIGKGWTDSSRCQWDDGDQCFASPSLEWLRQHPPPVVGK